MENHTDAFPEKTTILIVDDNPDNITLATNILKGKYIVKVANGGVDALKIMRSESPPDLVLLDVMMPGMDGYEVCRQLKLSPKTRNIPVIFLTASSGVLDETYGFKVGAVDYISKPLSPPILQARVGSHLESKKMKSLLTRSNDLLELKVNQVTANAVKQQNITMNILNSLVERFSLRSEGYAERIKKYVNLLSEALKMHPRFSSFLNEDGVIDMLVAISPLYELGKVGIPDNIKSKGVDLSLNELDIFRQYPLIGYDIISKSERFLDGQSSFINMAKEVIYSHNERWDGLGYPARLAEDKIPPSARIVSVASAYGDMCDRMTLYQSHESIVRYIKGEKGGRFDPAVVNVFLSLQSEFEKISKGFPCQVDDDT